MCFIYCNKAFCKVSTLMAFLSFCSQIDGRKFKIWKLSHFSAFDKD